MVLIEFKENLYTVYLDLIEVVLRKKNTSKARLPPRRLELLIHVWYKVSKRKGARLILTQNSAGWPLCILKALKILLESEVSKHSPKASWAIWHDVTYWELKDSYNGKHNQYINNQWWSHKTCKHRRIYRHQQNIQHTCHVSLTIICPSNADFSPNKTQHLRPPNGRSQHLLEVESYLGGWLSIDFLKKFKGIWLL